MMEPGSGPRSGSRDNGLRCAGYVAAGDLDPRVADALLDTLRSEGIAAYAVPTPASRGGYLELKLPDKLTDRVFVDSEKSERAMVLFEQEKADSTDDEPAPASRPTPSGDSSSADPTSSSLDVDTAWKQLLTSLQTPSDTPTWPSREDVGPDVTPATFSSEQFTAEPGSGPRDYIVEDDPEDEHYVPPKPPPFPRLQSTTVASIAAIFVGIFIFISGIDGGDLWWLGVLAILAGAAMLVWHMKDEPRIDPDGDDGAIV